VIIIPGSLFIGFIIFIGAPILAIRQMVINARIRREQAAKNAQMDILAEEIRRKGKAEREAGKRWIENWERELQDSLKAAALRREQQSS
jgi:uncharacterized membrane protein YqiK